jgi:GTP diphosphokinase / guanosine-3',5'-bis(diphosphate) 3'-diphosphatase
VAMAQDVRVILIKLADRLHNMRTIEYLGKQKQVQKAKETLEVYAPLAHRLGINKLKWELEDLAFSTLHPRKYEEIKAMVSERRADREEHVREAAMTLQRELEKVDIPAEISGRAKHFYSIYDKMAKKGREFNEIYDLTAMRVIAERADEEGTRDCYGALGLIHSLWKPMPGRFKDYLAMPKLNGYQALHTTVIGPEGRPLEIQVRTRGMHETAEFGVAAHWQYKHGRSGKSADKEWVEWVRQLMDWQEDEADPREFIKTFRTDLFDDEVYVFTPKGEVKVLPAGSTPIDFAYAVHTDVGHRTVGAKINGRIVPLHYRLKSGDFVEIMTTKTGRGPSRDWLSLAASSRARNKIRQWFSRETREETEHKGRETLETALKKQNLPYRKLQGSSVLAQVIRETGFKKAEDFYLALGSGKLQASQIVNKVIQRLKTEEVAEEEAVPLKAPKARHATASENFGIAVRGVDDVLVRLAKCCTPLPGDKIVGYVSLGKGITIHREDCSNVKALKRNPERFTKVSWDGGASQSFRVQIAVDSWDRPRLLEDVARTFAEHGANIVEYGGHVEDQLAKNWYVAEVGDVKALRSLLTALRNVDAVFDAYRVTPS